MFPVRRILAPALILAATLLALEIFLRGVMGNLALGELYMYQPGDGRCVGLKPNARASYTGYLLRTPPIEQEVNSFGYRGPARPPQNRGSRRIALIGASFTYGVGVSYQDTFAAALEAMEGDTEVLNFGVPGLNIDDIIEQYTAFAARWSPDLILYVATTRDIEGPFCGNFWGCNVVPRGVVYWITKSYVTRTLYMLPHYWLEPWRLNLTAEQKENRIKSRLIAFAAAARSNGTDFGMVIISSPLGWNAGDGLRQWGETAGVRILDLHSIVLNAENRLPRDGHLSARGHRLVAEAIHQWLRD
jgi:lysophospholipase L1-like esterase